MSTSTTTISQPIPINGKAKEASSIPHTLLPHAVQYNIRGSIPNTPLVVSIISATLGGLVAISVGCAAIPFLRAFGSGDWTWARPQLGVYGATMGIFHLLEFWTTAGWNPQKLSVDAFLINNNNQYHYAHVAGLAEYFISSYYFPQKFDTSFCSFPWLGLVGILLVAGQAIRSLAMIHASSSFSHVVKAVKHDDHTLVTNGVYAWSRHPSYVGFFYWAIATQLLLGNIVSTLGFAVVLGRFFSARIIDEEKHLVRFFGDEYLQYRRRVGTGLPFVVSVA